MQWLRKAASFDFLRLPLLLIPSLLISLLGSPTRSFSLSTLFFDSASLLLPTLIFLPPWRAEPRRLVNSQCEVKESKSQRGLAGLLRCFRCAAAGVGDFANGGAAKELSLAHEEFCGRVLFSRFSNLSPGRQSSWLQTSGRSWSWSCWPRRGAKHLAKPEILLEIAPGSRF